MFGLFGKSKKEEFIEILIKERLKLRNLPLGQIEQIIKQTSRLEKIGTPEASIVSILQDIMKLQKKGILIKQSIETVEKNRSFVRKPTTLLEKTQYNKLIQLASASNSIDVSIEAVPLYVIYRIELEYPSILTEDEIIYLLGYTMQNYLS